MPGEKLHASFRCRPFRPRTCVRIPVVYEVTERPIYARYVYGPPVVSVHTEYSVRGNSRTTFGRVPSCRVSFSNSVTPLSRFNFGKIVRALNTDAFSPSARAPPRSKLSKTQNVRLPLIARFRRRVCIYGVDLKRRAPIASRPSNNLLFGSDRFPVHRTDYIYRPYGRWSPNRLVGYFTARLPTLPGRVVYSSVRSATHENAPIISFEIDSKLKLRYNPSPLPLSGHAEFPFFFPCSARDHYRRRPSSGVFTLSGVRSSAGVKSRCSDGIDDR